MVAADDPLPPLLVLADILHRQILGARSVMDDPVLLRAELDEAAARAGDLVDVLEDLVGGVEPDA